MIVKVYIQLTEENRCVKVAVEKTFLWRIWKEIVRALNSIIILSGKIESKPQEKCLFQSYRLCVRSA